MAAHFDPQLFWRLTPAEIHTVMAGAASRMRREHDQRAWLAWHIAYMTAYAPTKSKGFFKLKNLLWGKKEATSEKTQDWRQSLAAFSSWVRSGRK